MPMPTAKTANGCAFITLNKPELAVLKTSILFAPLFATFTVFKIADEKLGKDNSKIAIMSLNDFKPPPTSFKVDLFFYHLCGMMIKKVGVYMALINCPECNKEISDKANSCPNCGYPINSKQTIEDCKYDVVITNLLDSCDKIKLIGNIRGVKGWGLAETKNAIEDLPNIIFTNMELDSARTSQEMLSKLGAESILTKTETVVANTNENMVFKEYNGSTIICPHCGSTAVTTGAKGFSLLTGFLGSSKTINRCGNCGYSWQP